MNLLPTLILRILFIVILLWINSFFCKAGNLSTEHNLPVNQSGNSDSISLYQEIYNMDSLLFFSFNAHDNTTLETYFTPDLEFYHDKGGLILNQQVSQGFEKMFSQNPDIHRDLVAGSMEVYPINKFGAVQIASHKFCHTEKGKPDCGTFKFIHLWKKTDQGWKISRVISYDH